MNLKERGITVGDLLIVLIVIGSATVIIKNINNEKESNINTIKIERFNIEQYS